MEAVKGRRFRQEQIEVEEDSGGLFGSVRRVLSVALAVFESRFELLIVELNELKGRAMAIVALGAILAFLSFLALVAIMATVVFALWSQALAVLAGFSGFFIILAVGSFFIAKSKLKTTPLEETVAQLRKDREFVADEFD